MRHRKFHSRSSQTKSRSCSKTTQTDFGLNISNLVDAIFDESTVIQSTPTEAELEENYQKLLQAADHNHNNDPVLKLLIEKRTEVLEDLQLLDQTLTLYQ